MTKILKKVCQIVNIPYQPLPIRNQSQRQPYKTYYDEELKQRVYLKFREEIEFGNYDF
ncbi:hypothetical protein [Cyanothece sp. BG0011]|uniref:hypothetical protein n=1 Tax=Cyanothece sp. BG0011 TaxID=2082950 RepID=UPI001300642E|nr:hypothetical protein [Cyanothece sp. BG0011]